MIVNLTADLDNATKELNVSHKQLEELSEHLRTLYCCKYWNLMFAFNF